MNDTGAVLEKQTMRKVTMRIIPFTFLLYIISYLDRANIGYAALQMNKDLALSAEVFGIVSGIFFIGYFLFEVPSNILMMKFGARVWIARILITWGIVSVLTGFAQNEVQSIHLKIFAWSSGGRIFPWDYFIFHLLVSIERAGYHRSVIYCCYPRFVYYWRTAEYLDYGSYSMVGNSRLEMDAYFGRGPRSDHGNCHLFLFD